MDNGAKTTNIVIYFRLDVSYWMVHFKFFSKKSEIEFLEKIMKILWASIDKQNIFSGWGLYIPKTERPLQFCVFLGRMYYH